MEGEPTGVTPASPAATPAAGDQQPQAAPVEQPASDGVKTPESTDSKQIPYERFQEVNSKAKAAEERAAAAEARAAELEAKQQAPKTEEPEAPNFDPDTDKALRDWAGKNGFVTKDELAAEKMEQQFNADVASLQAQYEDFDIDKVREFAKANGLSYGNKQGLETVYKAMKAADPSSQEAMRNQIIAELTESGQLKGPYAEKPGAGGAKLTPQEEPKGFRGRLHAASQKYRSS